MILAAADVPTTYYVVATVSVLISGVGGGLVGSWLTGWRMGRWTARIEARVESVEARLRKGDSMLDSIPGLQATLNSVAEELKLTRQALARGDYVRRTECDERHGVAGVARGAE